VTSEHVAATAYVWDIDWSNPGLTKAPEKQLRLSSAMRVNGELAVSRSIGDVDYKKPRVDEYPWSFPQEHAVHKQSSASSSAAPLTFNFKSSLVVCEPEWECRKIAAKDEFVILACDGLWDVSDCLLLVLFRVMLLVMHRRFVLEL
jgi:serine/threonine protein phosphatase PrpC